jgi:hypothetical protein
MKPFCEVEKSFSRSCRENSSNHLIQINVSKILVECEMIIILRNCAGLERRKK